MSEYHRYDDTAIKAYEIITEIRSINNSHGSISSCLCSHMIIPMNKTTTLGTRESIFVQLILNNIFGPGFIASPLCTLFFPIWLQHLNLNSGLNSLHVRTKCLSMFF